MIRNHPMDLTHAEFQRVMLGARTMDMLSPRTMDASLPQREAWLWEIYVFDDEGAHYVNPAGKADDRAA